ncbi:unnamed protein product, partial [Cylicostephanus goldi]
PPTPITDRTPGVLYSDQLPIEAETEVRPGNTLNRPEFDFEEDVEVPERPAASLYECTHNGSLDMYKAAQLILKQRKEGSFNQNVYDEFVRSEVASRIQYFRNDGLFNLSDTTLEMRLVGISSFMMGEIQCAKLDRYMRLVEVSERKDGPQSKPLMSVKNFTRQWNMDGPEPFVKVALQDMVSDYHPKECSTPFQIFAGLYRFLFMKITNPPQKIQDYAVRLNGRNGRNDLLLGLPMQIETLLLDFGEDYIGYGHNELKSGVVVNPTQSKYFMSLGTTNEERERALKLRTDERVLYRKELFKGLQLALRDVRSYVWDNRKKQWMPNHRKSKRTRLYEGDENEDPQRQSR